MVVISVNLPEDLLARIDRVVAERGYWSRSQFIREALEEKLGVEEGGGKTRILVVLSDHERDPGVDERVIKAAYRGARDLVGLYHSLGEGGLCITILVLRESETARMVEKTLRGVRGVVKVWALTA